MGVACSCQAREDVSAELVPSKENSGEQSSSEFKIKHSEESPALSDASTKAIWEARQDSQALSSSFHLEKEKEKQEEQDESITQADPTAKMLAEIGAAIQAQDFSAARDISKATAKVMFLHKANLSRDLVQFSINSKEQVPTIPLLEVKDEKIVCGTIPTIWALHYWPLWFPFCESNKLLRRFSPSCFVMNCTLKVLFLRLDFILFIDIADKLHTSEECLEILMRSPPPGSEGQEWLGITVPPKCGSLPRLCVRDASLRLKPLSMDHYQCDLQMDLEDQANAPQWVKVFVFQQLAVRILPELCKFQSKIPGSALDKFLNTRGPGGSGGEGETIDPDGLEYIFNMQKSIEKFVAKNPQLQEQCESNRKGSKGSKGGRSPGTLAGLVRSTSRTSHGSHGLELRARMSH